MGFLRLHLNFFSPFSVSGFSSFRAFSLLFFFLMFDENLHIINICGGCGQFYFSHVQCSCLPCGCVMRLNIFTREIPVISTRFSLVGILFYEMIFYFKYGNAEVHHRNRTHFDLTGGTREQERWLIAVSFCEYSVLFSIFLWHFYDFPSDLVISNANEVNKMKATNNRRHIIRCHKPS